MGKSALVLMFSGVWLAAGAQETIDRRVPANPGGQLEISNTAGSIAVEGSDQNEVHVTGELGENVERLDVLTEGDRVIVRVIDKEDSDRGDWDFRGTNLRIRAPRTISLDVAAVSADIEVRDMRGEQRLSSVSGDVDTEAFAAEVRARAVSGDVDVNGRAAELRVRASTVSGDVTVDNGGGEIWGESVSGDVVLRTGVVSRAETETVSGGILVAAELGAASRLEATAVSGDIELMFRGAAAGDYWLESFSGDIDNCFGPSPQVVGPRPGPRRELRFREGATQARVEARTHSGDIELCRE
jgi:DUF4097 and DUF4098 domain-containing protein YvlB